MNYLLVFCPVTLLLHYFAPNSHTLIFILACVSIVPLAGLLGEATEHLADKTGEGIGGLLNATFGNAAELIIAMVALSRGHADIVKASLTGSIIGNVLLVLGLAILMGGLKHSSQSFSAQGARAQSSMLTVAAISLVLPACYHFLAGEQARLNEQSMSFCIAMAMLIIYGLGLWFSLVTHRHFFSGTVTEQGEAHQVFEKPWTVKKCLVHLAVIAFFIGWISEVLVGSVEHAAHSFGMSNIFVGLIVVAVVGNAAEHSTAVLMAMKNRMDLAVGISVGSSLQIALFVAPILVLLSYFIAPHPLDLVFSPIEVLVIFLSVMVLHQVVGDGQSNWLEGAQLLALYLVMGIVIYFLPEAGTEALPGLAPQH